MSSTLLHRAVKRVFEFFSPPDEQATDDDKSESAHADKRAAAAADNNERALALPPSDSYPLLADTFAARDALESSHFAWLPLDVRSMIDAYLQCFQCPECGFNRDMSERRTFVDCATRTTYCCNQCTRQCSRCFCQQPRSHLLHSEDDLANDSPPSMCARCSVRSCILLAAEHGDPLATQFLRWFVGEYTERHGDDALPQLVEIEFASLVVLRTHHAFGAHERLGNGDVGLSRYSSYARKRAILELVHLWHPGTVTACAKVCEYICRVVCGAFCASSLRATLLSELGKFLDQAGSGEDNMLATAWRCDTYYWHRLIEWHAPAILRTMHSDGRLAFPTTLDIATKQRQYEAVCRTWSDKTGLRRPTLDEFCDEPWYCFATQ